MSAVDRDSEWVFEGVLCGGGYLSTLGHGLQGIAFRLNGLHIQALGWKRGRRRIGRVGC